MLIGGVAYLTATFWPGMEGVGWEWGRGGYVTVGVGVRGGGEHDWFDP